MTFFRATDFHGVNQLKHWFKCEQVLIKPTKTMDFTLCIFYGKLFNQFVYTSKTTPFAWSVSWFFVYLLLLMVMGQLILCMFHGYLLRCW